jgi:antitoxin MazE
MPLVFWDGPAKACSIGLRLAWLSAADLFLHVDTLDAFVYSQRNTKGEITMGEAVMTEQTIQTWGNGLAVRITAPMAKAAHVARGTPVTLEVVPEGFLVRVGGKPKMTLAQKLKVYDPQVHGGEVMADGRPVGAEVF